MRPLAPDVLLQGFHWNSHLHHWWRVIEDHAGDIADAGFTMVWLPPPSQSAAEEGYLPNEWYDLDESAYGTQAELQSAIAALHARGVKAICDVVLNHRVGTNDWADFTAPHFPDTRLAVTHDDEWGQGTGGADSGVGFEAGRDLDHLNDAVREAVVDWLTWLRTEIGFDGWRFDYVRGFHGEHVGTYNRATEPAFAVGEFWPDIAGDRYLASCEATEAHRQLLLDWIASTGDTASAFDFTTKWQLMLAAERTEYHRLGCVPGLLGARPDKAVTFLDNHDTGPSPGGGQAHWPFPSERVALGYAYLLTHPGTPSVYWPHVYEGESSLTDAILGLLRLRREQGITSASRLDVRYAEAEGYAAVIDGHTAVALGPRPWSPDAPAWVLRQRGEGWAVWTR